MKKMRGIIEPYTLGFLLALIGGITTYVEHDYTQKEQTHAAQPQAEKSTH